MKNEKRKNRKLRILSLIFAILLIVSSVSTSVFAANLYGCTWNTKYKFVDSKGNSYGTNTFIVYGGRSAEIKNVSTIMGQKAMMDFCNKVKFTVRLYDKKTNKAIKTYTVGFGEDFIIPGARWTKYTLKITPIINKKDYNKVGAYYMNEYYKYSLRKV